MKKTFSITIGGQIFLVEEDAYQLLDGYLSSMKKHFAAETNAEEILADIESGLADKFAEKANSTTQAITLAEAERVIAIMGRVDEITNDENVAQAMPAKEAPAAKRLYRNPADTIVAGVASGVAAYFGIDVLWVRIAFVVLALVNGLGILVYIVLWIIAPRAETSAQQLEMRGRPINVSEIQEAVKEKAAVLKTEGVEAVARLRGNDSIIRKIASVPVMILRGIVELITKIIQGLLPILGIITGVFILLGSLFALVVITITGGLLLFGIRSPYIITDLPITELATRPLYYVGIVSVYFVIFLPILFIISIGRSLVQRKNVFTARGIGVLVALWLISLSGGAVAAGDLVPFAYTRVQAISAEKHVTRTYSETGFTKLKITTSAKITVKQGPTFAIAFTGRDERLDRLVFTVKEGELFVSENDQKRIGPCIFCDYDDLEGEITLPALTAMSVGDAGRVVVEGFKGDASFNLSDAARVTAAVQGGVVTSTLKDASRLTLTGTAVQAHLLLSDASRAEVDGFKAETITDNQADVSRLTITGEAGMLTATTTNAAVLNAENLSVKNATLTARDVSRITVWTTERLQALITNAARLWYVDEQITPSIQVLDQGRASVIGSNE